MALMDRKPASLEPEENKPTDTRTIKLHQERPFDVQFLRHEGWSSATPNFENRFLVCHMDGSKGSKRVGVDVDGPKTSLSGDRGGFLTGFRAEIGHRSSCAKEFR